MPHDVFVSYSVKDKVVADAIVARLEADSIRCWVAPRDVVPGADWGESIIDAIENSRIMVLVFTSSANASPQIKREVERAVDKGVYTIPIRIENIEPTKSLEYFISTSQWIEAFPPPLEAHLDFLAKTVKAILAGRPPPLPPAPPTPPPQPAKARSLIWIAAATLVVLLLGGGYFFAYPRPGPEPFVPATATPTAIPIQTPPEDLRPTATAEPTLPSIPAAPSIAGVWHDSENPAYTAHIVQYGNRFTFTRSGTLPDGTQFKVNGNGTISGLQLKSQYTAFWFNPIYQTSLPSSGSCSGSLSDDGAHMATTCNDTLFGYSEGEAFREE